MQVKQSINNQFILNTYPNRGLNIVRGEGNFLFDDGGNKYLDLVTGFGVNIFGHTHPVITRALQDQLGQLSVLHGSFANDQRSRAASRLSGLLNNKHKVYFGNSGAEAIEAAIKFAHVITGKSKFIYFTRAYHGKSLAALTINGSKKHRQPFEDLLAAQTCLTFNQAVEAIESITEEIGAVFVEPIQGEGGINMPDKGFLSAIRQRTLETKSLMIVDEIQTGLGRTGKMLACEWEGVEPDIITLGKGLGGGIPVSATLVHKKFAAKIGKGINTSTTGGTPLACAGVNAVLDLLTPEMLTQVEDSGQYFLSQLKNIKSDKIVEVRGMGLMIGVELNTDINPVLKAMQQNFILTAPAGDNVIRFLPPYTITKEEVDRAVTVLDQALNHNT